MRLLLSFAKGRTAISTGVWREPPCVFAKTNLRQRRAGTMVTTRDMALIAAVSFLAGSAVGIIVGRLIEMGLRCGTT